MLSGLAAGRCGAATSGAAARLARNPRREFSGIDIRMAQRRAEGLTANLAESCLAPLTPSQELQKFIRGAESALAETADGSGKILSARLGHFAETLKRSAV